MGSDVFSELSLTLQKAMATQCIALTSLRFVLATNAQDLGRIETKVAQGTAINIATSNPRCAKQCALKLGCGLNTVTAPGGSVEIAPLLDSRVEAIVDLADSGNTLTENGLVIVRDNLLPVKLMAVWLETRNLQQLLNYYRMEE